MFYSYRDPSLFSELTNKNYVDGSTGESTTLSIHQTLENYLKVTVGDAVYNLTEYGRIRITDATIMAHPNQGAYILQQWNTKIKIKNQCKNTEEISIIININTGSRYVGYIVTTNWHMLNVYRDKF